MLIFVSKHFYPYRPEWGEWREVANLKETRANHFSIVCQSYKKGESQDIVYVMFGQNGKEEDELVGGIEFISLSNLVGNNGNWSCTDYFTNKKGICLEKQSGFLPDPCSERILIFGKSDADGEIENPGEDDDEDDEFKVYTYKDSGEKPTFTRSPCDEAVYTFDTNNTPMFFKGVYFVFGEDLNSIMKCDRDFTLE